MMRAVMLSLMSLVVACGSADERAAEPSSSSSDSHDRQGSTVPADRMMTSDLAWDRSPLVSRFQPSRGVAGTRIQVLTSFDPYGCVEAGTCRVTLGDVELAQTPDSHVMEALVPRWASTGDLCVTWRGQTECAGTFTVLDAPILNLVEVTHTTDGSFRLDAWGEAFTPDAILFLDAHQLNTEFVADYRLSATILPDEVPPADAPREVRVYSPSSGRCGSYSTGVTLAEDAFHR